MYVSFVFALLALVVSPFLAFGEPLEDNSFLVEEAYNQEPNVYQFIQVFQKNEKGRAWNYTFINEIPFKNEVNQLSYEIPVAHSDFDGKTQIADVKLNYRRELYHADQAVSTVRISSTLPSGDEKKGFGQGAIGLEASLIQSVTIAPKWVQHWNIGYAVTPGSKDTAGNSADTQKFFWAVSNVYLFKDNFNFMLEAAGSHFQTVTGSNATAWSQSTVVSPSVRYGIDHKGWQYVPGIAVPIQVSSNQGDSGLLLYLSIEGKL